MQNKGTKIMAIIALLGIIIGIVGTGIMFIIGSNNQQKEELEYKENNSGTISVGTGEKQLEIGNIKITDNTGTTFSGDIEK